MDALERYSEIITPWATKVAENFTADIARQNEKQWRQYSRNISAELRNMVDRAPVGQVMKSIVAEQIKYIKSQPHKKQLNFIRMYHYSFYKIHICQNL